MIKPVFCVYDMEADFYDRPMVFDNEKFAMAAIRRDCRDMFIKGDVTLDALRDRRIQMVAKFDSSTGEFENQHGVGIRMSDFVADLAGAKDEV